MNQMTLQHSNDENSPYYMGKVRNECRNCGELFFEKDLNEDDLCFDCETELEENEA